MGSFSLPRKSRTPISTNTTSTAIEPRRYPKGVVSFDGTQGRAPSVLGCGDVSMSWDFISKTPLRLVHALVALVNLSARVSRHHVMLDYWKLCNCIVLHLRTSFMPQKTCVSKQYDRYFVFRHFEIYVHLAMSLYLCYNLCSVAIPRHSEPLLSKSLR